ncbi:hypothetical protein [Paraflavitalea pollutisoli]|uniref:hypothetical protein n=1 Tax=Paraflavitalea pollutisoli TaxID=3034143 RepID=UPI0023ECD40A|nr:hypothetical protein [Paraflavitalea sp. H1-2-19X]
MNKHSVCSLLMAAWVVCGTACSDGGTAKEANDLSDSIAPTGDPAARKADTVTAVIIPPAVEKVKQALVNDILKADISAMQPDNRTFGFDEYDLNGDGSKEIIIGFRNPYFCGSGGCTAMLFSADGQLINKFTVMDFPIWILPTKTNGWNDLAIFSGGKYRDVKYGKNQYPSNPSTLASFKDAPPKEDARVLDFDNKTVPTVSF